MNIASTIPGLSAGDPYKLVATGEITGDIITEIKTALQDNPDAKVSLDLSGCTGLTTLPDNAFKECTSLTSVSIPNSVTEIYTSVFFGCSNLTSVEIPNGVAFISQSAFKNCTSLESVSIPATVSSIISDAFVGCSNLSFDVDKNNATYSALDDGRILFNKQLSRLAACPSATGDIEIPDGVTSIGSYAFSGCTGLTSVSIGANVESIGEGAFWSCTSLTSMTIPASVTKIGKNAFYKCNNLEELIFDDPETWYYTENTSYTGGFSYSLSDSATAARYLRDTYRGYYWYKE